MYYPTIENITNIPNLQTYKKVPIVMEIFSDFMTPLKVLQVLQEQSNDTFILESKEHNSRGRYTFLGYQPIKRVTSKDGSLVVNGKLITNISPKEYIREILEQYRSPKIEGLPTFTGGFVGYFAYDYAKYQEETLVSTKATMMNDIQLLLYDQIICFDHEKQKVILMVTIDLKHLEEEYVLGIQRLEKMYQVLQSTSTKKIETLQQHTIFKPLYSLEKYTTMLQKAKHYIQEGDIFQVVPSNRFEAKVTGSLFDVYRVLRTSNPSPYMFYIKDLEMEIVGASPETLVKIMDHHIYTYPLAGTRPRGKTKEEDRLLKEELLTDEKELAEHNMLVDLGRNDIGKVSALGSVKVTSYQEVEMYSHVMHISSTVSGILEKTKDRLDTIDAILPAGTLSGAPKIRAMQIIEELEEHRRGVYGGGIGYLDFTGNLDLCIAIRMAYKVKDQAYIHAGGGIVYDSDDNTEYQETLHKAKAMIEAFMLANGGIENDIDH
jgi:anthranilate synthase component 1